MLGNHPVFAVLLLLLLAALVALGVLAVARMWSELARRPQRPGSPGPFDDPAFTELRMRYARSEIDWDDYVQRAATLGYPMWGGPAPSGPPPGMPGTPSGGT